MKEALHTLGGHHSDHPAFTHSPLSTVGQTPSKRHPKATQQLLPDLPVSEPHGSVIGCAHSTGWARRSGGNLQDSAPRGAALLKDRQAREVLP